MIIKRTGIIKRSRIARRLRRMMARRTLRWKLTVGLVLVLIGAFVLAGVATAISLRGFLLGRLDSQLSQAGGRFSISLEHGATAPSAPADGDADNSIPGQAVGTLGVRLAGGAVTQAAVVLDDGGNRVLTLSAQDQATLAAIAPTGTARTVQLHSLGDYRVVAVRGLDADIQLTGLPLRPVEDTVARLLAIEAALFVVIVIMGAAASAFFVRWTLRPLNRVVATALGVSELPLSSGQVVLPERDLTRDPGTEIGQVGVAFDHMLDHVETALRARNATEENLRHFIADASHELRTPLATIRSHAEFARRSRYDLPEPIVHALDRVESESIRMGVLVDDLLLLARLDAGRPLAREQVDITRLVLDAMSDARAAGPDHQWRLELPEEPIEVQGDGHRLQQVLTNLLANARTHTPAGTQVRARVAVENDSLGNGTVVIDVHDDGPGIPPTLLPTMFERFTRADSARSHATGNTGLGLAIAYGIVQAHGGTLSAQSAPGDTNFQIRLPERREAPERAKVNAQ